MDKRDKKKMPCKDIRTSVQNRWGDAPSTAQIQVWCNCCGQWTLTDSGKAWRR